MNAWGIPDWLEKEVRERDTACVYCGVQMIEKMPSASPRRAVGTWEHIINDARIATRENIARCCVACNASKGAKQLSEWIESRYCKKRGISQDTIADVVKRALLNAKTNAPNNSVQLTPLRGAANLHRWTDE